MATLSLIGLYNYDNTLFDGLTLPTGIDKDICVNEILRRCGEFELIYSDLDFNKSMIAQFGNKHMRTFTKWIEGLAEEFNPLHNYDRHEIYTDTHKSNAVSNSATSTSSNADRKVSAYDASTMQPKENETSGGSGTGSAVNSSNDEVKHEAHLYGNIGVTTSTQMLEDFLRVERWNIYEHIADIFCDEFCIPIY